MTHCPTCMSELRGSVRYCPECGTPNAAAMGEVTLPPEVAKQSKFDFKFLRYLLPINIAILVIGGFALANSGNENIIGIAIGAVAVITGLTIAMLWWRRIGKGPQSPGRVVGNIVLGAVLGVAGGIAMVMILGFIAIVAAILFILAVCSKGC